MVCGLEANSHHRYEFQSDRTTSNPKKQHCEEENLRESWDGDSPHRPRVPEIYPTIYLRVVAGRAERCGSGNVAADAKELYYCTRPGSGSGSGGAANIHYTVIHCLFFRGIIPIDVESTNHHGRRGQTPYEAERPLSCVRSPTSAPANQHNAPHDPHYNSGPLQIFCFLIAIYITLFTTRGTDIFTLPTFSGMYLMYLFCLIPFHFSHDTIFVANTKIIQRCTFKII